MAKKATEKKSAEKMEEEVKTIEAEVSAVEEKTAAAEAVPAEEVVVKEPKKRGRKPGSKNTVKTIKKDTDVKKTEVQDSVYVQFSGEEIIVSEVMDKARTAYVAEGHRLSSIKSLRLYIKPEEKKAYYVINEKAAGSIEL